MTTALTLPDKDPTASLGFPPALPLELAARSAADPDVTIQSICEGHGISRDRWNSLRVNPVFQQACEEARDALALEGGSFKAKIKTLAEALLPRLYHLATNENYDDVPASVQADMIKTAIRVSGQDASIDQKGAAQGKAIAQNPLMIQINLR